MQTRPGKTYKLLINYRLYTLVYQLLCSSSYGKLLRFSYSVSASQGLGKLMYWHVAEQKAWGTSEEFFNGVY